MNSDLRLSLQANYSKSEAALDPINMPAVSEAILQAIENGLYDYSIVNTYSDLSYDFLNARLMAGYKLMKNLEFTVDVGYYDLTDNKGYVYGIESGSFYVVKTGLRFTSAGW